MGNFYHEVFKSPFEKNTEKEAQALLDKIRAAHPESHGWKEINSYIEKLPNGKFRAVREHEKRN